MRYELEGAIVILFAVLFCILGFGVAYSAQDVKATVVQACEQARINQTIIENVSEYHTHNDFRLVDFAPRKYRPCSWKAIQIDASGQSMQYFANDQGISYVDPVSFKDVELGDVILFKSTLNNGTVLHAVIYLSDTYALTAGYANNYADPQKVYPENVTYRHCDVVR